MTLEEAGRLDDALATYSAALEVYPDYMPALQGLARLTVRQGRSDERLCGWLETIALRSEEPAWRAWAEREISRSP
jgi:hypothetical protein